MISPKDGRVLNPRYKILILKSYPDSKVACGIEPSRVVMMATVASDKPSSWSAGSCNKWPGPFFDPSTPDSLIGECAGAG